MVMQAIRDRMTGILAIFILAVLVVPFAFFGIEQYFVANPENVVAKVNDREITVTEYQQSLNQAITQRRRQAGDAFDRSYFDDPVVRREHLERMIDQALLSEGAITAGIAVPEEMLAERIGREQAFQVEGRFDPELYRSRLQAAQYTPEQYERELAVELRDLQLPMTIGRSSIVTDSERDRFIRLQNQTRDFTALKIPAANYLEQVEVSDQAVQDYYDSHPDDFMSPEQVVLEYLELAAEDFADQVEVSEEMIAEFYENNQSRFMRPEERLASHILISVPAGADEVTVETARDQAAELAEQARAGADFGELAQTHSEDPGSAPQGGDLGWIEPGVMVQAFEDALYALDSGAISDPVQTNFGWHVIQLRDVRPATGMSLEEARPQLLEELRRDEAERLYLEQADRMVDLSYEDSSSLEPAAQALGMEIETLGPFGRNGGDGLAADPQVIRAAFSELVLEQQSNSEPLNLGENRIMVLRLREHLQPERRPLEAVRDEIAATLRFEAARSNAREIAEGLLQQAREGAALATLAGFEATVEGDTEGGDETAADGASEAEPAVEQDSQERAETDTPETDTPETAGPPVTEDIPAVREGDNGYVLVNADAATRFSPEYERPLLEAVFDLPAGAAESGTPRLLEVGDDFAVVVLSAVDDGDIESQPPASQAQARWLLSNAAASEESEAFREALRLQADIEVYEDNL